jgi:uncharacterized protein
MEREDARAAPGRPAGDAGSCPFTIGRPVMTQRWERLTFLHWPFEPALVQGLLPAGLRAETFGGAAWVGLVPFFMGVGTGGGRRVPWASNFCETNVRTYVRDRAGRSGIWFFSLDAARLGAVATARAGYRLPYFWSDMRVGERAAERGGERGDQVAYACRRRWAGGVTSRVRVSVGAAYRPGEATERDHFLTARWLLFSVAGARHRFARACHEPWPLCHAAADVVDDGLVRAAGLPQPAGAPLVHYSPGVDVRIGRPES